MSFNKNLGTGIGIGLMGSSAILTIFWGLWHTITGHEWLEMLCMIGFMFFIIGLIVFVVSDMISQSSSSEVLE